MSRLLLNLRNVPDDEADDVRALLAANAIAFYETRPNRWGISGGAIWIVDDAVAGEARRLMDTYQAERRARVRSQWSAAQSDGSAPTWRTVMRDEPLRVVLIVLAAACVLGLAALPALLIAR